MTEPGRLFVASAAVLHGASRAYWTVLAVRVVADLELEPVELTLLGTALELSILVAEVPTGVVADLVSRRLSIVISFLVMGPAMAMAGLVEGFWPIAATQLGWGVGYTFQSGADVAWVTDELHDPARVDRLLIRRAQAQMAATIVGVGGAAALSTLTTRSATIVVTGAVVVAWGVFLVLVMPEREFTRRQGASAAEFRRVLRLGGRMTLRTPMLRVLAIAVFVAGVAAEALDRLDVARMIQVGIPDGLDEVVLVAGLSLAQAVVGIVIVREVERRTARPAVPRVLGALLIGAGIAIAVVAGVSVLGLIVVALIGQEALRLGAEPLVTTIANSHEESEARATVLSFVGQANAAGEITGGVVLGALASATSLSTAFVVSAALFVVAGLVVTRAR